MSDTPEPFVDLRPASPEPVELWCTNCGYNLSGTVEDRCSECGQGFDRAALVEWTTGSRQALPAGPLLPTTNVLGLSLFSPSQLGRLLPPRPDLDAAKNYSVGIRVLAGGVVPFFFSFLLAGAIREFGVILGICFIPLPVWLASAACEALIAALLARFVDARAVRREDRYPFWRTLCRCFCGHLLVCVTAVCLTFGAVGIILNAVGFTRSPTVLMLWMVPYLAVLGSILWWWYCLGRAVVARGAPSAARTAIVLLIPVVGLAAIALGIAIGMVEGFLISGLVAGC